MKNTSPAVTKQKRHMEKYDIQLQKKQIHFIKRETRQFRNAEKLKREIPRRFLISCIISGIYIYFGVFLNLFSYYKTFTFGSNVYQFISFDSWDSLIALIKIIFSIKGLLKFTAARYLIGYPSLLSGTASITLSSIAYCSMQNKSKKTFLYRILRIPADLFYVIPPLISLLFVYIFFL